MYERNVFECGQRENCCSERKLPKREGEGHGEFKRKKTIKPRRSVSLHSFAAFIPTCLHLKCSGRDVLSNKSMQSCTVNQSLSAERMPNIFSEVQLYRKGANKDTSGRMSSFLLVVGGRWKSAVCFYRQLLAFKMHFYLL